MSVRPCNYDRNRLLNIQFILNSLILKFIKFIFNSIIHKSIEFLFNSIIDLNVNRDNYDTNSFVSNICVGGRGVVLPLLAEGRAQKLGWGGWENLTLRLCDDDCLSGY